MKVWEQQEIDQLASMITNSSKKQSMKMQRLQEEEEAIPLKVPIYSGFQGENIMNQGQPEARTLLLILKEESIAQSRNLSSMSIIITMTMMRPSNMEIKILCIFCSKVLPEICTLSIYKVTFISKTPPKPLQNTPDLRNSTGKCKQNIPLPPNTTTSITRSIQKATRHQIISPTKQMNHGVPPVISLSTKITKSDL